MREPESNLLCLFALPTMVMTGVAGQHVLLVLETFFLEDLKQELLALSWAPHGPVAQLVRAHP